MSYIHKNLWTKTPGSPRLLIQFKKVWNALSLAIQKAKADFNLHKVCTISGDPRKIWELVNGLTSKEIRTNICIEIQMRTCSAFIGCPRTDESAFYKFWQISRKQWGSATWHVAQSRPPNSIVLVPATPSEVEQPTREMRNNIPAGVDGFKVMPITYCNN